MVTTRCILAVLILFPALASYSQPVKLGAIPTTNVVHGSNLFLMQQSATAGGVARLMTVSNFFQNVPTNQAIHRGHGHTRGLGAVDLQIARANTNQVAEGAYSFIGPGAQNSRITADGSMGVILSGLNNVLSNFNSVILWGGSCTNGGPGTVMYGGECWDAGNDGSGNNLVGGTRNKVSGSSMNDAVCIGASDMTMISSGDSVMLSSYTSTLNVSRESGLLGGSGCVIHNGIGSAMKGAAQCTMTNVDHCVIDGGILNKLWNSTNFFIGGGSMNRGSNSLNGFTLGSSNLVTAHNAGAIGFSLTNTTENTVDLGNSNGTKMTVGTYVQFRAGQVLPITPLSGNTTLIADERYGVVEAQSIGSSFTITLPAVANTPNGYTITIIDAEGFASINNITIDGNGSEQINGALSYILNQDYESVTLMRSATSGQWIILSQSD